jgi:GNAT superfamily N-acetyltransferase
MPAGTAVRSVSAMPRLEVRPFDAADLPEAAALLAERHRRHRLAAPLLPARFEDPAVAAEALPSLKETPDAAAASGAAAFRDGRMVAYVLGAPKANPVWGPNIWIESAGVAAVEPEAVRDAYAAAAARWVDEGLKAQYVLVPAADAELLRAWYRLGFGQQHAHGLRDIPPAVSAVPADLTIRRVVREDIPVLAELEVELPRHQGLSPTFSAGVMPRLEECIEEWESDIDSPDYTSFVAVRDGKVIGSAVGCALEKSGSHIGLARPDNAGFLGFAAVLPAARGSGAGRALGEAVIAWCGEAGYDSVVTDWRVTNLLSSRAWPALGFAESFVRLHRLIGY